VANRTYPIREIAIRLHYRLVFIHPWVNGTEGTQGSWQTVWSRRKRGSALLGRHTREPSKRRKPPKVYIQAMQIADANKISVHLSNSAAEEILRRNDCALGLRRDPPNQILRSQPTVEIRIWDGGADRIKPTTRRANDALYQLSYCPLGKGSYLETVDCKSTPILAQTAIPRACGPIRPPFGQRSSFRHPWEAG